MIPACISFKNVLWKHHYNTGETAGAMTANLLTNVG